MASSANIALDANESPLLVHLVLKVRAPVNLLDRYSPFTKRSGRSSTPLPAMQNELIFSRTITVFSSKQAFAAAVPPSCQKYYA
jgi:hypothetical protein